MVGFSSQAVSESKQTSSVYISQTDKHQKIDEHSQRVLRKWRYNSSNVGKKKNLDNKPFFFFFFFSSGPIYAGLCKSSARAYLSVVIAVVLYKFWIGVCVRVWALGVATRFAFILRVFLVDTWYRTLFIKPINTRNYMIFIVDYVICLSFHYKIFIYLKLLNEYSVFI